MSRNLIALGIALLVALAVATAVHASPAPDEAESDCSWAQHGTVEVVGDTEYRCLCAQLTASDGHRIIACRWYATETLPKAKKIVKSPKPRKHVVHIYPLPKVVG